MYATENEKYLVWKFTAYEIRHYARIALAPHRVINLYTAGIQLAGTWDVPSKVFTGLCFAHGTASAACLPANLYVASAECNYPADNISIPQLALYLETTDKDIPDEETITISYPKKA